MDRYYSVSPEKIISIAPGEIGYFEIDMGIPSYKGYEEHDLRAVIRGVIDYNGTAGNYLETQNIKLVIQEIPREDAEGSYSLAEQALSEMKDKGFSTSTVEDLLADSVSWLNASRRNKESWDISQQILEMRDNAFGANDLIRRLAEAMQKPRKSNLITGNFIRNIGGYDIETPINNLLDGKNIFLSGSVEEVVSLAIAAFERGDYSIALERAEKARALLILERKGNFLFFIYLYWYYILIAIFLLTFLGILFYRRNQKLSVSNSIAEANKEESNIKSLLVSLQKDYFAGKISESEHDRILSQHRKKLANLRETRLGLRNKRIKMLRPRQIVKDLSLERTHIEREIKSIQKAFYVRKEISPEEYNIQFKILNGRLAEIEGERVTLQVMSLKGKLIKVHPRKPQSLKLAKPASKKTEEKILKKSEPKKARLGGFLKKLKWKLKMNAKMKKDKKGIVLMDSRIIEAIKRTAKNQDVKGKWIHINHKDLRDEK